MNYNLNKGHTILVIKKYFFSSVYELGLLDYGKKIIILIILVKIDIPII